MSAHFRSFEGGWRLQCLLVKDHRQERTVDFDFAVVFDEAQFPELVHEKIDASARGANHFRQRLLRNLLKDAIGLVFGAVAGEQEKGAGQPLLTGVEELIDEVFFDTDVPREDVGNEAIGEFVFRMKDTTHFFFVDDEDGGRQDSAGGPHANRLASEAAFSKKVAGAENCDDGFFSAFIEYREPHATFLDIHDAAGGITLREYGRFSLKIRNPFGHPNQFEVDLWVKGDFSLSFHVRSVARPLVDSER